MVFGIGKKKSELSPVEYNGKVVYAKHDFFGGVGTYSLMVIERESSVNIDFKPVILYDTEVHGKNRPDSHNREINEGDLVQVTLNARMTSKQEADVEMFCPAGFFPVFSVRKIKA